MTTANKRTGLYRHFDEGGILLYIGISLSSMARLKQHQSSSQWSDRAVTMTTEWYDSRAEAIIAEKEAIKSDSPVFNIIHNKNKSTGAYWGDVSAGKLTKELAKHIGVYGGGAYKVLEHLGKNKTDEDLINGTIREVAVEAAVTTSTVSSTFKRLQDKSLLKKIRNGCYLLSPHLLRHGSKTRGAMLIRLWETEK